MERRRNKNQICHFREKCAFTSNALFSRKYRFCFRSETEKRTSGASGTAKRRSNACKGGRAESSQGRRSNAENEHLPTKSSSQQLSRREVQPLCSVFATLGGQHAPHWRRHGKEAERNGGRIVFCLSFVHEYGGLASTVYYLSKLLP